MATWATSTPIRHPWFSQPTTKRKHSASSSPAGSPSHSPPPTKRRKFSALESGFAHLTLSNPRPSPSSSPPLPFISELFCNSNDLPSLMSIDSNTSHHVVLPTSVEEPLAPEVKMKISSWYEPEPDRIIVTDLDSFSDEEDEEDDPDKTTIMIPRALLKQLSTHSRELTEPPIPQNPSQALVLFRPLPPTRQVSVQISRDVRGKTGVIDDIARDARGDDAMDVEPW